jgi:hypothetical protein
MLEAFMTNLHQSTQLLSQGKAVVLGHEVDAVLVRNLYGQEIVWGMFSVDKGKFKGRLSNSAATEAVQYTPL